MNQTPNMTPGSPAYVNVNYTFTGAAGTDALVTNVGTPSNALLDFTVPQGAQGVQGIQGPQGEQGVNGTPGIQGVPGLENMTMNQTPNMTPGPSGGTGGQVLFFNHTVVGDPVGYEGLFPIPSGNTEEDEAVTVKTGLGQVLIDAYATFPGYPGVTVLPAGLWRFRTYHYVDSPAGNTNAVFAVYNRTSGGTETLLFTATSGDIGALVATEYLTSYVQTAPISILNTDRIVIKVYGQSDHASNIQFHFVYDGSTHTSHVQTPLETISNLYILKDGSDNAQNSYAYLPGRAGGQTLTGGTTSGNLVLNGSMNNGDIILQPTGGNIGIGTNISSKSLEIVSTGSFITSFRSSGGIPLGSYSDASSSGIAPSTTSVRNLIQIIPNTGIRFWGGNTVRATVTDGGGFGIGTSFPSAQFDTTGSVRFRNCSGTPTMDAGGNMTCASDEKVKKNIKEYNSTAPLPKPIQYKWSDDSGFDTTHENIGFSAQQVQQTYPECIISRTDIRYEQQCSGAGEEQTCETVGIPTGTYTLSIDQTCMLAAAYNTINRQQVLLDRICSKGNPSLCKV